MLVEKSKNLQQILGATRRERRNKCGSRVHRRVQTRLSKTREKTLSILVSDEETLKPATTKQQRRLRYRSFTKVGEGFASFYQEVLRGIARTEARRINKRFFAKKKAPNGADANQRIQSQEDYRARLPRETDWTRPGCQVRGAGKSTVNFPFGRGNKGNTANPTIMPLNRSSLKIQPLGCGAKQGLRKHFCPGYLFAPLRAVSPATQTLSRNAS